MDYSALGKRIKNERHNVKLTQAELAEKANVTTAFIGQIERGERKLSIETLVDIACSLNVSTDFLLRGNMERNTNSATSELLSIIGNQDSNKIRLAVDILKSVFEYVDKTNDR